MHGDEINEFEVDRTLNWLIKTRAMGNDEPRTALTNVKTKEEYSTLLGAILSAEEIRMLIDIRQVYLAINFLILLLTCK